VRIGEFGRFKFTKGQARFSDRNAEKKGLEYIREFSKQMWKQMGMRVFVLSASVNGRDGTTSIGQ
jgi:hypothetical protein